MLLRKLLINSSVALVAVTGMVHAESVADKIIIEDFYVLAGPAGQANTAGYLLMRNEDDTDHLLVAGSSPIAGKVELHTIQQNGDLMEMVEVENFVIPQQGEIQMMRGGDHIMFIGLTEALEIDSQVPVTLIFEDNSSKAVAAEVRDMRQG